MTTTVTVKDYFDSDTSTFTYLVIDDATNHCVVIDPVLDYDMVSGHVSTKSLDPVVQDIQDKNLTLDWILETHAHADHLTGAQQLKQRCGGAIAIGRGIIGIQKQFKDIYGFNDSFDTSGNAFDKLMDDGDSLSFGKQQLLVLATPGHTKDSLSFRVDNYLFIGDTLFHPDTGSARCDFPGGNASVLYESIIKILNSGEDCILCLCHDYPGEDRQPETYIPVSRMRQNIHLLQAEGLLANFVKIRENRDQGLALPKLIIPSIQVNCQAGLNENQQEQYLVWPINRF